MSPPSDMAGPSPTKKAETTERWSWPWRRCDVCSCSRDHRTITAMIFLCTFIAFYERMAFTIAFTSIGIKMNLSESEKGSVFAAYYYGFAITQVPGGYLANRFGGTATLTLSFLLWAPAAALVIIPSRESGQIVVGVAACRFAVGIGQGMFLPAAHSVLAHWVPSAQRGTFFAFAFSGMFAGAATAMVSAPTLVSKWGSSAAFGLSASLAAAWVVIWLCLGADGPSEESGGVDKFDGVRHDSAAVVGITLTPWEAPGLATDPNLLVYAYQTTGAFRKASLNSRSGGVPSAWSFPTTAKAPLPATIEEGVLERDRAALDAVDGESYHSPLTRAKGAIFFGPAAGAPDGSDGVKANQGANVSSATAAVAPGAGVLEDVPKTYIKPARPALPEDPPLDNVASTKRDGDSTTAPSGRASVKEATVHARSIPGVRYGRPSSRKSFGATSSSGSSGRGRRCTYSSESFEEVKSCGSGPPDVSGSNSHVGDKGLGHKSVRLGVPHAGQLAGHGGGSRRLSTTTTVSSCNGERKNYAQFPWREMLSSPAAWACVAGNVGAGTAINVVMSWLPTYFEEFIQVPLEDMSVVAQLSPYLTMMVFSISGGVVYGWLILSQGLSVATAGKIVTGTAFASALVVFLCMGLATSPATATLLTTFALASAAMSRGGWSTNHVEIAAPQHAAMLYSIANCISSGASVVGLSGSGKILDALGGVEHPLAWTVAMGSIGALCAACGLFYVVFAQGNEILFPECATNADSGATNPSGAGNEGPSLSTVWPRPVGFANSFCISRPVQASLFASPGSRHGGFFSELGQARADSGTSSALGAWASTSSRQFEYYGAGGAM